MSFNLGIIGLPNAGKSTIFNALTRAGAQTAGYPFTTIEPNTGIITLPDSRLYEIAEITKPEKITPTTVEFVDVAGLVRGASKGEGLGNQFLGHIRNLGAILHVVRCSVDENVAHPEGEINPRSDIEVVETELMLADLATVEKRISKVEKAAKSGDKESKESLSVYTEIKGLLDSGKFADNYTPKNDKEKEIFGELNLLTQKPVLFVANIDEVSVRDGNNFSKEVEKIAAERNAPAVIISGKIEEELLDLDEAERREYLKELGLSETGLIQVIRAGYKLLRLITFYTTVGTELRAWSIPEGTHAQKAAGSIHTDMERGFIKAEVISTEHLFQSGSEHKAKEEGRMRIEGKEYIVKDGDILHIKFNV